MTETPKSRPWKEFLSEMLQDPDFAAAYYEMEPEFQVARQIIRLRLEQGLTKQELAERVGIRQSSISRLENASVKPSLGFQPCDCLRPACGKVPHLCKVGLQAPRPGPFGNRPGGLLCPTIAPFPPMSSVAAGSCLDNEAIDDY